MTNSQKNRIAVVSTNKDIADFFSLEARLCSLPVQIFSKLPYDTSELDIIVFDSALGTCVSDDPSCKIITVVTTDDNTNGSNLYCADETWEWPVAIETVRDAFEGRACESETERTNDKGSETVIYVISESERKLLYLNQQIYLTESEWKLFKLLGTRGGEPVSRAVINAHLGERGGNLVEVHVCNLRKKLEAPFGRKIIINVRSKGYYLNAEIKMI